MPTDRTSRRSVLLAAPALLAGAAAWAGARTDLSPVERQLREIEKRVRGRLGVAAFDSTAGRRMNWRANERFPMCSTFKVLAVAAVLKRVEAGKETLDRPVRYGPSDMLPHSPMTASHVKQGTMPLRDLCAAAVKWSDNTAANLILRALGGPESVTAFAREIGDKVTRLDRWEPALNSAIPGDPRDTTSPAAMAQSLYATAHRGLSPKHARLIEQWMIGCKTGEARLRAGLPPGWRVGDKTGTGVRGTTNDIAIIWPPRGSAIFAAAYLTQCAAPDRDCEAALADVGRAIAQHFA